MLVHEPTLPVTLHDWHELQLALSQQTPSTQKPLTHSLPAMQVSPARSLQLPEPSQACVPPMSQVLGGVLSGRPNGMLAQVPGLVMTLHDWQVEQTALQHRLSTQWPLRHWTSIEQATPRT